jgi:hypothetical protein
MYRNTLNILIVCGRCIRTFGSLCTIPQLLPEVILPAGFDPVASKIRSRIANHDSTAFGLHKRGSTNPLVYLTVTNDKSTMMEKSLLYCLISSPAPFFDFTTDVEEYIGIINCILHIYLYKE